MSLGSHLKGLREARGVSLRKTASALGIEPSYLSKIERDEREPSEEVLTALAAFLEANPDLLLVMAGKVTKAFREAVMRCPEDFLVILKRLTVAPPQEIKGLARQVRDGNW